MRGRLSRADSCLFGIVFYLGVAVTPAISVDLPSFSCDLEPYDLTVEHLRDAVDVVAIDPDSSRSPRFSFKATTQFTPAPEAIASNIQVIRRRRLLEDELVWDSGWVFAGRRNGLDIERLEGQLENLIPLERLVWRARFGIASEDTDTNHTIACPWSQYSSFVVGPSQEHWEQTGWVCAPNDIHEDCDYYDTTGKAAAPIFRSEFQIKTSSRVSSARLFVSGLGHYEAWMNGIHINRDRFLDPAPTSYDKRIYYNSFDVTDVIDTTSDDGSQAMGFLVGSGWYNPLPMRFWGRWNLRETLTVGTPRVKCILMVEYQDENEEPLIITTTVKTGSQWKTTPSGLLRNDLYLGNTVDLDRSKWLADWSIAGFDSPAVEWDPVIACQNVSGLGKFEPQPIPPIRTRSPHNLRPISRTHIDNDIVLDMGLNAAAAVRVEIHVPTDWICTAQQIELKYGEILFPDGTVNALTSVAGQIKEAGCCGPCAPDVAYQRMLLRTTKSAEYTTQFSWSGFRYIQISSLPPGWTIDVTSLPLMTDLAWTSSFSTSNNLLNEIYAMCVNTHASNMLGIQSDCPHRERFGYTGDALATLQASLYMFDGTAFYEKRLYDVHDAIRPTGGVTETAPSVGIASQGLGDASGPIGWQTFFPGIQTQLFRFFGNTRALKDVRQSTRSWIAMVLQHSVEVEIGLGDWMATDKTPVAITGCIFVIEALKLWSVLSDSESESVEALSRRRQKIQEFSDRFLTSSGDLTINGSHATQGGQAMALHYSAIPNSNRSSVARSLIEQVNRDNQHVSIGMFGAFPLFDTLTRINASDLAWKMAVQTSYPSYGYMLQQNATTLWESWSYSNNTFSHNHPMFSGIVPWITEHVGGIRVADTAVGADLLIFAVNPPPSSKLTFADFTLETARGEAICKWGCQEDGTMAIQITCPVNARGHIFLPDGSSPVHIRGGMYHYVVKASLCQSVLSVG